MNEHELEESRQRGSVKGISTLNVGSVRKRGKKKWREVESPQKRMDLEP